MEPKISAVLLIIKTPFNAERLPNNKKHGKAFEKTPLPFHSFEFTPCGFESQYFFGEYLTREKSWYKLHQ